MSPPVVLLRYMSKIQKESNSQHDAHTHLRAVCCCDICQRYKKKAIHNGVCSEFGVRSAVAIYVKDTKRKQFTTWTARPFPTTRLLRYMSKIQKESNSQHMSSHRRARCRCCDICQRYKKKAIHNSSMLWRDGFRAVAIYVKDTKRKQFTTPTSRPCAIGSCCDICQRYKKKAIHNFNLQLRRQDRAVAIYVKDTKRKQFTTPQCEAHTPHWLLRYMSKIQKESNSQHIQLV